MKDHEVIAFLEGLDDEQRGRVLAWARSRWPEKAVAAPAPLPMPYPVPVPVPEVRPLAPFQPFHPFRPPMPWQVERGPIWRVDDPWTAGDPFWTHVRVTCVSLGEQLAQMGQPLGVVTVRSGEAS